jgi:hypothetical protein
MDSRQGTDFRRPVLYGARLCSSGKAELRGEFRLPKSCRQYAPCLRRLTSVATITAVAT